MDVDTAATVLPFDIQMLVIDAASTMEITDVLRTCALTCHDWSSRARRHLYSTIILTRRRQFTLLSQTLTDSPGLGSLVLRLCLILANTGVSQGQWDHIPFTPHAISQLTSLQAVTFGCYFKPIPKSFFPLMRTFATCLTLKTLYFLPMQFPTFEEVARVVLSFPRIEALYVASCSWDEVGNAVNANEYPGYGRNLRELKASLVTSGTIAKWLTSPWYTPQLLDVRDAATLLRLFAHCSIAGIEWWPSGVRCSRQQYTALSEFHLLETLEVHCPHGQLGWVVDVLPHIRSEKFRGLAIVHPCHEQTREKAMQQWVDARLDDILSEPPFLQMQQLRLCFLCSSADAAETQWWQEEIVRVLPKCHKRRLIELEVVDRNVID